MPTTAKLPLMTLNGAARHSPAVDEWLADHQATPQGALACHWFNEIRALGDDVVDLVHDNYATACVGEYPFAYTGCFKAHANLGFFLGAQMEDPAGLLQGTGKRMRHIKLVPGQTLNNSAVQALVAQAYSQIKTLTGAS